MVKIKLEYQPFRFLTYTREINGSFPSEYHEIQPKQLTAIANLVNQRISETDFLSIITGIKKNKISKLDDYHRYALMSLFDPFTDIKPYNAFIIPEIKYSGKTYCSPKPKMAQVTFAQFIFAEAYFENYQTNQNPIDLYKFVASLYLRENHAFNENEISAGNLFTEKTKPEILDAIVINYILIKEWLSSVYPMIFHRNEEYDENNKAQPKTHKNPGNSGWIKIFENIVGDDLVNHDRYAILPLHNVLRWMTDKLIENSKRK